MAAGFLNAFAAIPQGFMQGQQYAIDQNYQQALRDLAIQQQRQQMAQNLQRQQALGLLYRAYGQGQPQQNPNPFGQPMDLQAAQQFTPPPQIPQTPPQAAPATMPPRLGQRILGLEGNQDNAIGAAGELGPGQIKPSTGAQYGYSPPDLLGDSGRKASSRIAGDLYRQSGGDPAATLVGYNAGPGAMRRFQAAGDNPASVKLSPAYAAAVRQELSPEQHQQATQVAVQTATALPPQLAGQLDPRQLKDMIERAAEPGTPDEVKAAALIELQHLMAPQAQAAFKQQVEGLKIGETHRHNVAGETEHERHDVALEERPRGSSAGGKMVPATDAYESFIKEHPKATAAEKQAFISGQHQPRAASAIALRTFIDQYTREHDGKPPGTDEIRTFLASNAEAISEGRTVGTRSASLELASNTAAALIPLARELSHKVDRTKYPDLNSLILAYETKTGDPTVVQLGEMVNALRYTYARALSPTGQARVDDVKRADSIIDQKWSQGQFDAALDQIEVSLRAEKGAIGKTRSAIKGEAPPEAQPTLEYDPATGTLKPIGNADRKTP